MSHRMFLISSPIRLGGLAVLIACSGALAWAQATPQSGSQPDAQKEDAQKSDAQKDNAQKHDTPKEKTASNTTKSDPSPNSSTTQDANRANTDRPSTDRTSTDRPSTERANTDANRASNSQPSTERGAAPQAAERTPGARLRDRVQGRTRTETTTREQTTPDRESARDPESEANRARSEAPSGDQPGRAGERQPRGTAAREGTRGEGERQTRAQLGLQVEDGAEGGMTVQAVEDDTVAAQAGFRTGDRILSVDGRTFRNLRQLQAYLGGQFGRRIPVVIDRGGQRYSIQLTPPQPSGEGAWLGVYLEESAEAEGALVTNIYPSGPAARAGMRSGDIITQVNGQKVTSSSDLIAMMDELEPGSRAEAVVLRNNQAITLNVPLGRRDTFVSHYREDRPSDDQGEYGEGDDYDDSGDVPYHAMRLEHDRRMAEQHQRIESQIRMLQEEVRKLRETIEQRRQ